MLDKLEIKFTATQKKRMEKALSELIMYEIEEGEMFYEIATNVVAGKRKEFTKLLEKKLKEVNITELAEKAIRDRLLNF